ncbi:FecR family protein [Dyadobacter sp. Leaf189]|uniref:FecR family protein n=1 Tax=Dyadobacter sp. Leaf189 TaxID=1736295 RepID=UPI0007001B3D|nr:FecR family protein [Dyadobacter sp. Leaf189]KQS30750.1 iron dicitrate transport regulator FecR [Dyadobacter sp. Leaf189]
MDQYLNFEAEDFVWDPFFRQWVLAPTRESDAAWTQWLAENPQIMPVTRQARQVVLALRTNEPELSASEIDSIVKNTVARIQQTGQEPGTRTLPRRPFYKAVWFRFAASVALLIVAGWWLTHSNLNEQLPAIGTLSTGRAQEQSEPQQIKKTNATAHPMVVKLSDGSQITLSPSSSITYPVRFTDSKREVVLNGYAFFEISKDPDRPFFVYANELITKVLGTSFTINAFESSHQVTVEVKTGRVSVFTKAGAGLQAKAGKREQEGVVLSPNQKIIFERDDVRMVKTLVEKPEIIVSKSQVPHFEFEDTPASQAIASIGKAYGIDIIFDEELLNGCPVTAMLDNQTLHEKLSIICKAIEANYEIIDGQIVIHSRGCRN